MIVTQNTQNLLSAAQEAGKNGLPPVHLWNPPFCGDLDMRIARDGTWFHEGTPIGRPAMVRLFSTILRKDGDKYFLVTPVEKVGITVEDVPFIAVDFERDGSGRDQRVTFVTNVGDRVTAGPDNPLRLAEAGGEPVPYVLVRDGLEARIDRKSFYRLIEIGSHADHDGASWFGLWSDGLFFPLIPSADLT
ncbi:DUF1285 domain-containing protein [Plastorhodobacter daqingensis]|uniref:DUF1285 domain-containing protein n=1 Tax=Plastorhodobacter daqingensis TaxID=1387281 RepID=A0ABW2UEF6_9RHOB